jgi:lipopolysaccharide transport system ATP-binding protein
MAPVIIEAENISKQYRLGVVSSKTLSDDIKRGFYRMLGKPDPLAKVGVENDRSVQTDSRYVWALKDINFSVHQGEVLGIIGRNGAGKSTLLKILSRITKPSTGEIRVKGRIASLLEVGTGFHPELTGRENIYLNGAILGMSRHEVKRKFDEIVAFSGVARYVDTPVKRYSSGMYVRLAFAVAAHLEPDILVLDEVLAVGDSEFQKKCLGKMKEVAGAGRTVLFVSHNMGAVSDICENALLIEKGRITCRGDAAKVIREYVTGTLSLDLLGNNALNDPQFRRGGGQIRIKNIKMFNALTGKEMNEFQIGDDLRLELEIQANEGVSDFYFLFGLRSSLSREMVTSTGRIVCGSISGGQIRKISLLLPSLNLSPGVYETYYWIGSQMIENPYDVVDNLTSPLVIKIPTDSQALSTGYFKLPFKLDL